MQLNGKVYLGHDDQEDPNNGLEVVRLMCKDYVEKQGRTHAFFSHYRPDYLLEQLNTKFTEQGQEFEVNDTTWKLTFDVQKQINEQIEGQPEVEPILEMAKIQVEITKVPNQDKYCVDFQRKAGSAILFYDSANKYIDLMELCNNTTIDEEVEGQAAQQ